MESSQITIDPSALYVRRRCAPKLDSLPEEDIAQICEWMKDKTYREIGQLIEKHFGMTASKPTLTKFYKRHVSKTLIDRRELSRQVVVTLNKEIKARPAAYDAAVIDALMERIHKIARQENNGSAKNLKLFTDAVARIRGLMLAENNLNLKLRTLSLLERKEELAKEALQDKKLSSDEVASTLREIFKKK